MDEQGWRPAQVAAPGDAVARVDTRHRHGPVAIVAVSTAVVILAAVTLLAVAGPADRGRGSPSADDARAVRARPAWTRPELPVIEAPRRFATGVVRAWGGPDLVRPDQVHVWVLRAPEGGRGALVTVDALGRVPGLAGTATVTVGGTAASIHRDDSRQTTIVEWNVPGAAVSLTATGLTDEEVTRLAEGVFVPHPSAESPGVPALRWTPDGMEVLVERSATAALSGPLLHPVGGNGVGGIHAEFVPGPGEDMAGGFSVSAARDRGVTARDLTAALGRRARLVSLPGGRTGVVFGPPLREGTVLVVDGGQGVTLSASSAALAPNELLTAVANLDLELLTAAAVAQSGGLRPVVPPALGG